MNYRQSHNQLTHGMFPMIPMHLVNAVNKRVDNPNYADMFMNSTIKSATKSAGYMKNPYDIFSLTSQGHRSRNHDILSGMFSGAMQAKRMGLPMSQGMMAAISHQMADYFSNHLVQRFGVTGRNVVETMMFSQMNRRK